MFEYVLYEKMYHLLSKKYLSNACEAVTLPWFTLFTEVVLW